MSSYTDFYLMEKGIGLFVIVVGIIAFYFIGLPVLLLIIPAIIIFFCIWTIGVLVVKTIKNPADPQIFGDSEPPALVRLGIVALCLIVGGLCFWWFWAVLTKFVIA